MANGFVKDGKNGKERLSYCCVGLDFLNDEQELEKYNKANCKKHDRPAADGDQQASKKWAATGLKAAEMNGAREMNEAADRTGRAAVRKMEERKKHDKLWSETENPRLTTGRRRAGH